MKVGSDLLPLLLGQAALPKAAAGFGMSFETLLATGADQRGARGVRAFGFEELGLIGLNAGIAAPGGESLGGEPPPAAAVPLPGPAVGPRSLAHAHLSQAAGEPTEIAASARAAIQSRTNGPAVLPSAPKALGGDAPVPLQRRAGDPGPGGEAATRGDAGRRLLQKLAVRASSEVKLHLERTPDGLTIYAVAGRLDPDEIARLLAEADEMARSHGELLSEFNFNGVRHAAHANPFRRP